MLKLLEKTIFITPILLLIFSSGCSQNPLQPDYDEPDPEVIQESEYILEEDVGEKEPSSGPEESATAENEILSEEIGKEKTPDPVEPFLLADGKGMTAVLTPEEQSRRQLPYRSSNHLSDMFFCVRYVRP